MYTDMRASSGKERTAKDAEGGGERGQGVLRLEHVHQREAEG